MKKPRVPRAAILGTTDRSKAAADGALDNTTEKDMVRCCIETVSEPMYLWASQREGEDGYVEAVRPQLPLRGDDGAVLDPAEWAAARAQASAGFWSQVLSETPSGRRPPYCLAGDRALEPHVWMRGCCS